MKQLLYRPIATLAIVMCASNILSGCAATTPNTASDTKSVKQIADGHKMLYEKMEREFGEVHEELDALNSTQAAQEFVLTRRLKQV